METAVDRAIVEIQEKLATFGPQLEGLRDYARLNLKAETQEEVGRSIAIYERRTSLLNTAQGALKSLVDDGHPDLPVREVQQLVFEDLKANAATIEAALAQFASNEATSMTLGAEPAEPK